MTHTAFRPARAGLAALTAAFAFSAVALPASADEVNVYTTRQPDLIQPLFDAFTEETGTTVNVLFGQDELVERMQAEGANSPADVLISVDIGTLRRAKDAGVSQPIESSTVEANVPEHLRDPDGHWVALSARARIVLASRDRVEQDTITYEELADPKWRGKILYAFGPAPLQHRAVRLDGRPSRRGRGRGVAAGPARQSRHGSVRQRPRPVEEHLRR